VDKTGGEVGGEDAQHGGDTQPHWVHLKSFFILFYRMFVIFFN
jgi:hypothetical protein